MIALSVSLIYLFFYVTRKYLSKQSVAPAEPWHCLLDFPARTHPFSPLGPTPSPEVLRGAVHLSQPSTGNTQILDHFDGCVIVSMVNSEDQQSQEMGCKPTKKNDCRTKILQKTWLLIGPFTLPGLVS